MAIDNGNHSAKMAHIEKRAAHCQRRSNVNKEKGLFYIELAGKHPDCFEVYMEKANYFLSLSEKHVKNANMYFDKSKNEFKQLKKHEEN